MTDWQERVNPGTMADRTALDHDMYGVEVEVEFNASYGHIARDVNQYWQMVADGSLRNHGNPGDAAYEFRYTKPLNSFTSALAVKNLCQVLNTKTNKIYYSGRTSTHVHVNVCNINKLQIMNFITLAAIFDEWLVSKHHPFRSGNLFALRFIDAEWSLKYITDMLRTNRNFRKFSVGNSKYASVNLTSIEKYGTIEFRSMDGELDPQRINQWVFCLHQLKRKAVTYKNPRDIVEQFHLMGPIRFLGSHIPPYYTLDINHTQAFDMLSRGIILASDVAYASDWATKIDEPNSLKSLKPIEFYQHPLSPPIPQSLNTTHQANINNLLQQIADMPDFNSVVFPNGDANFE